MAWPTITVECMFTSPTWEDISPWVQEIDVKRGVSRVDSPLLRFEAGTCNLRLDNRDRRFDPTNLAGPYTTSFSSDTGEQLFVADMAMSYGHGYTIDIKSAVGQTASIVNVTSVASGTTGSFTCPKPSGTLSGHKMIAIHTCDVGVTGSQTLSGGSSWGTKLDTESYGTDTIQTSVYHKTAGGAEPTNYTFGQDAGADGVVTIITIANADVAATPIFSVVNNISVSDFLTPATTPAAANDLELRWVAGTWPDSSGNTWQSPEAEGYTEYVDKQSGAFTTAALAVKSLSGFGGGSGSQVLPNRPVRVKAAYPFTATTNYVRNPSFEEGTTSWSVGAATASIVSTMDHSRMGGSALKLSRVATAGSATYTAIGAVAAGAVNTNVVTISAYLYIPAASYNKITAINIVATNFATTAIVKPVAADGWYRVSATKTLSGALGSVNIQFVTDDTHSDGQVIAYLDGVQAEVKPSATDFCDGSQPGCTWAGTANDSASSRASSVTFNLFKGFTDVWDIEWDADVNSVASVPCTDGFKLLTGNNRPPVGAVGAGEDSGARITRILNSAAWPLADRVIATGDVTLQATTLEGDALGELTLVADTEIGELYIDEQGRVVFRNREAVLSDTRAINAQVRFGDGGDTKGELTYADVGISNDANQIANQVRITRVGGAPQTATDSASITNFTGGIPQVFERDDLLMQSDAEALSYAQWVLFTSSEPELRFETLFIKPQKDDDLLFPQVLGRAIGDRIEITRRPVGGGDPIIREVFIRGIEHTIRQYDWSTTYNLQSASKVGSFLTLNHPVLGIIGQNALVP